jgi:hypothetical protein
MPPNESTPPAPDRSEPQLARAARLRRRRRDAAVALTLLGAFLFASPLADVFAGPRRVAGLPLGATYLYLAWLGLIVAAARLARGLAADDGDG